MKVNKNFMNFTRLIITFNQLMNKSNTNYSIDFMMIITSFSMTNLSELSYTENDKDFIYEIDNETFIKFMNDSNYYIKNFDIDEKIKTIKPEFKALLIKYNDEIILNKNYYNILHDLSFYKEKKIQLLKNKMNELISQELYIECISIRDEINNLNNSI